MGYKELNNVVDNTQGLRLKKCCEEKGMTQKKLANLSGYTPQYISNLVSGKRKMSVECARNLSKHLNVREDYLLCKDDDKTIIDKSMSFANDKNIKNLFGLLGIHDSDMNLIKNYPLFQPDFLDYLSEKRQSIKDITEEEYEHRKEFIDFCEKSVKNLSIELQEFALFRLKKMLGQSYEKAIEIDEKYNQQQTKEQMLDEAESTFNLIKEIGDKCQLDFLKICLSEKTLKELSKYLPEDKMECIYKMRLKFCKEESE